MQKVKGKVKRDEELIKLLKEREKEIDKGEFLTLSQFRKAVIEELAKIGVIL